MSNRSPQSLRAASTPRSSLEVHAAAAFSNAMSSGRLTMKRRSPVTILRRLPRPRPRKLGGEGLMAQLHDVRPRRAGRLDQRVMNRARGLG